MGETRYCRACKGKGLYRGAIKTRDKEVDVWYFKDCPVCHGKGYLTGAPQRATKLS